MQINLVIFSTYLLEYTIVIYLIYELCEMSILKVLSSW